MFRCVHETTVAMEKQYVSVVLGTQHATHMDCTVICGLSASAVCYNITSQMARILKRKKLLNRKSVF